MPSEYLLRGDIAVLDYRCDARPHDVPFTEVHERFSLSYVRCGSFGCRAHGRQFDLIAGGFLVGHPGDEFSCSHDHHVCGDECLSIQLDAGVVGSLPGRARAWQIGALPPLGELSLAGEFVQGVASGGTDVGLDEAALWLVFRFLRLNADDAKRPVSVSSRQRRAMLQAADWIDQHSAEDMSLATAARAMGLSPFHFLRTFKAVTGLTPHQQLIRARLRRGARRLLEDDGPVTDIALKVGFTDVSNFINSFRRAVGIPPSQFRRLQRAERNIFRAKVDEERLHIRA